MVLLRNGNTIPLSDTRFKLKIDIGALTLCLLYGWDICDVDSNMIHPNAPDVIADYVIHSPHQIGGGWTAARQSDLSGVVKRGELNTTCSSMMAMRSPWDVNLIRYSTSWSWSKN
jgi:hypothetical protein